ncbi:bifunctional phosphopantothenoylcysteine decarboxylase/phosphopantothenate--cysteine ligase CoaBC [Fangia hongkongensis]|uniref:bifunctional phosphopantothenoylcysteine decarboxylase/phosphopantothenate--cysteine ligase CoaBC n=1 Tax=Fangia hongkongensis TaxID=270495 RepID=UPI0003642640|nr:bifunctional phosphopantothenoylcysteine decarboxylase/phosphopantothenate--cysteine ligase CoaBC [Fangia hongkongensis]MBK2125558.1 bifunctional phosphopantothenoylcysteine decarboxylase/phosphopantothenate--cysteine ligase CoaBC [Fangia hongkongensis]
MKNILLCVTGSIACYKALELLRLLQKEGFDIKVLMTDSAKKFVTALSFEAISKHPVYDDLFDYEESSIEHIDLAKWADLIVIAPATANTIAKLANGIADDLLGNVVLATQAPLMLAPAMNQQMYKHITVAENLQKLQNRGYDILATEEGEQACGDVGEGRLLAPEVITSKVVELFAVENKDTPHVVITAGPTIEPIDPVRFISNHSSGKMGYALAKSFKALGAKVTLISGPTNLEIPYGVKGVDVKTANQMHKAVHDTINRADIFISAAAVVDFKAEHSANQKIKKQDQDQSKMHLSLIENKDILKSVSLKDYGEDKRPFCVGFAAETENAEQNALAKIERKNLDLLVLNQVNTKTGYPFYHSNNSVSIYDGTKTLVQIIDDAPKEAIAKELADLIMVKFSCYAQKSARDKEKGANYACN